MFKNKFILFLAIIFFVFSFFIFKHHFSIFYFQNDIGKTAINIESKDVGEINICFDKNCDKMQFEKEVYTYELNQQNPMFYMNPAKTIEIVTPKKDSKKSFGSISIFYNLNDIFYVKQDDIKKIETYEIDFQNTTKYGQEIAFNKANNKTFLQKFAVYFEGVFYNWYFYLISYILILSYLILKQNKINVKIKNGIYWILLIGLLLRVSHIDYLPLWNDELYTFCFISDLGKNLNLERTFLDPGNPPLFFIISNVWLYFFNKSIFLIRLLPCLIGLLQIYSAYFVAKKIFNEKIGLTCAFLSAINIILILESNEIRSYILSMTLILWGLYWFYQLKNNFNYKNLIIYFVISILLINIHYYCIFFVLANFILGIILFKNNRLKFLFTNMISAVTFLPYLFKTVLNFSLSKGFNTWIEKPSLEMLNNHVTFYFGNIIFFFLTIAFSIWIFKKLKNQEKFIFLYTIYSITIVFISALIISLIIKPVLFERYFIIFIPFLILNTSIFLNMDYETKFKPLIICTVLLFSINMPKYENFNLFSNINLMAKYSFLDSETNKDKYHSYYIIPDKFEYIKFFPFIDRNKVIVLDCGMLNDDKLVDKILNNIEDKKSKKILYFPEQTFNYALRNNEKLKAKKIKTTLMRVYKVYIE